LMIFVSIILPMPARVCGVRSDPYNGDCRYSKGDTRFKTVLVASYVEDDDLVGQKARGRIAFLQVVR
jgi:hypothetical protein